MGKEESDKDSKDRARLLRIAPGADDTPVPGDKLPNKQYQSNAKQQENSTSTLPGIQHIQGKGKETDHPKLLRLAPGDATRNGVSQQHQKERDKKVLRLADADSSVSQHNEKRDSKLLRLAPGDATRSGVSQQQPKGHGKKVLRLADADGSVSQQGLVRSPPQTTNHRKSKLRIAAGSGDFRLVDSGANGDSRQSEEIDNTGLRVDNSGEFRVPEAVAASDNREEELQNLRQIVRDMEETMGEEDGGVVIAVAKEEDDDEEPTCSRNRFIKFLIVTVVLTAIIAGTVGALASNTSGPVLPTDNVTDQKTIAPTATPTASPTSIEQLFFFRQQFFTESLADLAPHHEETYEWIMRNDTWMPSSFDEIDASQLIQERYAMAALHLQTNKNSAGYFRGVWPNRLNWISSTSVCNWFNNFETLCDQRGRVVNINLESNGLQNYLPSEIGIFSLLQNLTLAGNIGMEFSSLPTELGLLTSLRILNFGTVSYSCVPSSIGRLSNLRRLQIDCAEGGGILPAELGLLTLLTECKFGARTGSIPTEIGNLEKLTLLQLNGLFDLTGTLPTEIGRLTELKHLDLADIGGRNSLNGNLIPSELGACSKLTYLDLTDISLSGTIPTEIGNWRNMTFLGLESTFLTGSLPTSVGALTRLTELRLDSRAEITGQLPSEIGRLSLLKALDFGGGWSSFSGTLPTTVGQMTSLTSLLINSGQMDGQIPSEIGALESLFELSLAENAFSGSIPSWIGLLTNLRKIDLSENRLSGSISSSIGFLRQLTTLSLAINALSGSVPTEIFSLSNLDGLYLQQNNLTGSIPELPPKLTYRCFLATVDSYSGGQELNCFSETSNAIEDCRLDHNCNSTVVPPRWLQLQNV